MDVEHADESLKEIELNPKVSCGQYEQAIVKGFRKRMQLIRAAADERELYAYRGNRFEKLSGDREGQYSMVLTGNWRLILKLVDNPSGSKTVRVIEIVDYH